MALERNARPLARYLTATRHERLLPSQSLRTFTTTPRPSQSEDQLQTTTSTSEPPPTPSASPSTSSPQKSTPQELAHKVHTPRSERRLYAQHGLRPIGSRRRRAAIAFGANIPFPELPYQCFQEARKVLREDREEKVREIESVRGRIERLRVRVREGNREMSAGANKEGRARAKEVPSKDEDKLRGLGERLEELKVLADINDPVVKKRFEDGFGDMNKPIYRHQANLQWRSYKRKILLQRLEQMTVIPDILPYIDPTVSTSLSFGRTKIPHGDIVPSTLSEQAPKLRVQTYEKGEKLLTIAVVNPDVPNVEKDGFDYRCHFLAANIPISPTHTEVDFARLDEGSQVIVPWLPAYAQKGLPYQRMAIFIFEQTPYEIANEAAVATSTTSTSAASSSSATPDDFPALYPPRSSTSLPVQAIKRKGRYTVRENFILRSFASKYRLDTIGADLFRTKFDEGTAEVMARAGVVGGDVEFRRKKVEPLPYRRLKSERYR